jgi:hypothetical protein
MGNQNQLLFMVFMTVLEFQLCGQDFSSHASMFLAFVADTEAWHLDTLLQILTRRELGAR